MRKIRAYLEDIAEGRAKITGPEAHHLIHVLRMQAGQRLEVFDGKGGLGAGVIDNVSRSSVGVDISGVHRLKPRAKNRITIASSIAKGQKFDRIITQCTELGVERIIPVVFDRTVKQPRGKSVMKRYRNLAVTAAKQCGRNFLPEITGVIHFADAMDLVKGDADSMCIYGGFSERSISLNQVNNEGRDTFVFVGPEGGLTGEEEKLLAGFGAIEVCINENILRTEMACIAFASILAADRVETR